MKKKLLVSFSGGETSAYMAQWLWSNKQDEFDMVFVFANTGQENEETLVFVDQCAKHFGFPVYWIEGISNKKVGVGTTSKVVDFHSADREGKVFESFISVYSIPNQANPQCTRELKAVPINHFARKVLGWSKFYTAIGIRSDEADRINSRARDLRLIYPLINKDFIPSTKQHVNLFWENQPFRLQLKGYQGNCKWCWKKSLRKLEKIAFEAPEKFDFPIKMEEKYGNYFPEHKVEIMNMEGREVPRNITFFREKRSAKQILESAKDHKIIDDSQYRGIQLTIDSNELDLVGGESCEVYSECNA
jgi:hypothetical protein